MVTRYMTGTSMTNAKSNRDGEEQPTETAMRQFRALHQSEKADMLNQRKVKRMAREAALNELVDAIEERRYYELVEQYRAESRSSDVDG